MTENEIARIVVDCCIKIHRAKGPGLFESVYESILEYELRKHGLDVKRQVPIQLIWDGQQLGDSFYADLIVNGLVLLELKAVEKPSKMHARQVATYLSITGHRLGMVLNFGSLLMKDGIERVVNGLPD